MYGGIRLYFQDCYRQQQCFLASVLPPNEFTVALHYSLSSLLSVNANQAFVRPKLTGFERPSVWKTNKITNIKEVMEVKC